MSIFSQLQADPTGTIIMLLYRIPAVLIALTLHELAHGYVALRCGDPTAQMMGRLSFNPLRHLDPIGAVFMLLFGFGWARPVPVNPRNFRRFRLDDFLVSIAGITVNLLLFLFTTVVMVGLNRLIFSPEMWQLGLPLLTPREFLAFDGVNFGNILTGEDYFFVQHVSGNMYNAIDASALAEYIRYPWLLYLQRFFMIFSMINLSLAVFNFLPIPPLDGYHVFNDVLARGKLQIPYKVIRFLTIALMLLCFFTNIISNLIGTVIYFLQGHLVNGLLWLFGGA